jgi:hypothetical protein
VKEYRDELIEEINEFAIGLVEVLKILFIEAAWVL